MKAAAVKQDEKLQYKHLIEEKLWNRLVNRISEDEQVESDLAEKIMNEALGFLKITAEHPGNGFSPSPLVDIGWHTFILYTKPYAEFCDRVAGRFIHHMPTDDPDAPNNGATGPGIIGTMQFMIDNGYPINAMLWVAQNKVDCTEGWGERCEAPCQGGQQCEGN